ncbi:MAG: hypothetical protein GEU78_19660 [Actinobacteria bacterium]|nr:hypothetical protein [Actinomycetota bacterium]
MKKLFVTCLLMAVVAIPGTAVAAGTGGNAPVGDAISDGFFGNGPNLTGPACCDTGPAEQNQSDPGSVAGTVVGSGSPGPATIAGNFVPLSVFIANENGADNIKCDGGPLCP